MQPIRVLEDILWKNSSPDYFIYSAEDLHIFFPEMSYEALMKMLSRAEKANIMKRVCKGIYLYPKVPYIASKVLYLVACRLRSGCFNYISLESVLCSYSIISQQMLSWLTVMTSGRSNIIRCGSFGTIEFVHTEKGGSSLNGHLYLDKWSGMLTADAWLAMKDEKNCRRKSMDLIDWDVYEDIVGNNNSISDLSK